MREEKKNVFKEFSLNVGVLLLACVLFAASFPNLLFPSGLGFLAWFALIPVFWLTYRLGWIASFVFGAVYGFIAYGLYNYWLSVFHPLAGLIVGVIYLIYFVIVFPLLKASAVFFPKKSYLVQFFVWLGYEYLRTKGFVAYAYGIIGYTQWAYLPLIQIASIFGVWGVSALLVFPQTYIAYCIQSRGAAFKTVFFKNRWPALIWAVCLIATLGYGLFGQIDLSDTPTKRIALIQHNTDPWRGGIVAYWENYRTLKRLSDEALALEPKPDLVVWSETAFVPRIYWHTVYRDDEESYPLVKELMDYLSTQTVPFVIGNDDARKEINEKGVWDRVDYNAVMLIEKGVEKQIYRKLHLVPFTEHFPYEKQFPSIYEALKNADTHFWKKGDELTVFNSAGIKFSTPICFEDTFGYLSRDFVRAGAELIVNLTNDAWAKSLPSQMQHATMAVFRAVENRRTVVRSTASGQTCAIDPNGRIIDMAQPFIETQLSVDVPIYVETTSWYTRWGDIWALIITIIGIALLAFGLARSVLRLAKRR